MRDGKLHWKSRDLTAQTFGALTALRPAGSDGKKLTWVYRCVCGREVSKVGADVTKEIKRGGTPNCGCMTLRLMSSARIEHGMTSHPAYAVWSSMKARCQRKTHKAWMNYGGRGIRVCQRWLRSFENFWSDMGSTYRTGLTLDRINNDGHYTPANCRWADRSAQARNSRRSVKFDATEIAARWGISKNAVYYRARQGLPLEGYSIFASAAQDTASSS